MVTLPGDKVERRDRHDLAANQGIGFSLYPASIDDATERHDAEAILSVLNLEAAAQRLSAVKQKQCRCCYVGKG